MKMEAIPPAGPVPPLPRTDQEKYVKTVITKDAEGRTRVNEVHYTTTIYDSAGKLKEVTRTSSRSYLV